MSFVFDCSASIENDCKSQKQHSADIPLHTQNHWLSEKIWKFDDDWQRENEVPLGSLKAFFHHDAKIKQNFEITRFVCYFEFDQALSDEEEWRSWWFMQTQISSSQQKKRKLTQTAMMIFNLSDKVPNTTISYLLGNLRRQFNRFWFSFVYKINLLLFRISANCSSIWPTSTVFNRFQFYEEIDAFCFNSDLKVNVHERNRRHAISIPFSHLAISIKLQK